MRRLIAIAVASSPLLLALACTHAEGDRSDRGYRAGRDRAYASHTGERVIAGRLLEVTPQTITISEPDGDQRTLWLDRRTSVTVDGRAADLDDLRPGEDVRAAFGESPDGHRIAVSIATGGEARGYRGGYPERERR